MISERFSSKEVEFLKKYYPNKGKGWSCKKLNRSEGSIRWQASKLGLKQSKDGEFFKDWQKRAAISKIGKKRPEHSIVMKQKCKDGFITGLNKPKADLTKEEIMVLSERAKKRLKEHGHPRGMLGKKHTEETKKAISECTKKMWEDSNNYVNSKEHRQVLSDRMSKSQQLGILSNRYSRSRRGVYDINGKKIFLRSSWEANYALYLDYLIKQKQIKKWEYEKDTFWFEKIRRGVRSYKPDFKIYNINNSIEYHEVKGWMDAKSKTKLKRMAKYYPEIKLILIDEACYKDIKNKLGSMLKFY